MSFVLHLQIGRFDFEAKPWLHPLEIEAVAHILEQYSDRELDGTLPKRQSAKDGSEVVLGWFDGQPVIFNKRGFLHTYIGYRQTDRLFAFIRRVIKEMGCVVYAPDAGEFWTERVLSG